jgi:vacuolar-type H+-ATPase subunit E/Vma4
MKVLQATEELVTNREVLDWLQDCASNEAKHKLPNNLKQLIQTLL